MVNIPTEIITDEILAKLPVKSLVRFKCVSKFYNTVISSPEFIDLHLRQSLSSDANRLLIFAEKYNKHLYSLDVDSQDPTSIALRIPLPRTLDKWLYSEVSIVGSFNGLLCVGVQYAGTFYDFVLDAAVFSLRESEWKLVEDVDNPTDQLFIDQNVLMKNHLLNWLISGSGGYRIYCFDVRSDKWTSEVPLMDLFTQEMVRTDEDENKVVREVNLGILQGCMCLSARTNLSEVVWMMKEYGVKESWVKLFDISCSVSPDRLHLFVPFGYRKGSKHVVLIRVQGDHGDQDRLFWHDTRPDTNGRTEEIKGVPKFHEAFFFMGSLVPIPGGEQIEESTNQGDILEH
ncbi:hypothetical protein RND81_10G214800 [Saponaria officinalis]|uniref:F-box domain-containing protein n=1 Tax=Saponaria officinalis TaxID=3572 RepID=A0AAW1I797_SAPOF